MLDFLKFAFQDMWHWLGITIWLSIIASAIAAAVFGINSDNDE